MSERFYTNLEINLGTMELRGAEAHHLAVVSRIAPGDEIGLFSGDGREFVAEVLEAKKSRVILDVKSFSDVSREPMNKITVYSSIPKAQRCDFLIEKLTEIGVYRFVPIDCEYSVIKSKQINTEKLRRGVIEACKQSHRNHLMEIAEPVTFEESIRELDSFSLNLFANLGAESGDKVSWGSTEKVNLWIGPEGGFSTQEIKLAINKGLKNICIGKTIMRVETAAIVLAALAIHGK
jgi:16S rRNA (uracil1498-N3)-methyltransferase